MLENAASLARSLEPILAGLLSRTKAMRCTIRIDHPALGLSVNTPCAEVLAPGAASMMLDSSIDHRRAKSVRSVEKTRKMLIQGDVFADPLLAPPQALVRLFGTRSQLVAPLIGEDDYLFGWLSAHFSEGPRAYSADQLAMMEHTVQVVLSVPGMPLRI